jgi:hypothetical protein
MLIMRSLDPCNRMMLLSMDRISIFALQVVTRVTVLINAKTFACIWNVIHGSDRRNSVHQHVNDSLLHRSEHFTYKREV